MTKFVDTLFNLRYFFIKNDIQPEDVKIMFSLKNPTDLFNYNRGLIAEVAEMDLLGRQNFPPVKLLGIEVDAEVAKPPKDGKDYVVDSVVSPDGLCATNLAIRNAIAELDHFGAKVTSVVLREQENTPWSRALPMIRVTGKRI